ncbi:hypothetical protein SLE2022_325950 [Rubroshorea leprosula]
MTISETWMASAPLSNPPPLVEEYNSLERSTKRVKDDNPPPPTPYRVLTPLPWRLLLLRQKVSETHCLMEVLNSPSPSPHWRSLWLQGLQFKRKL